MEHVTDRLPRWLGAEMDAAERASVEAHLDACPACREEADALDAVWRELAAAEPQAATASVWPAVRGRTVAGSGGWFFGRRPLARAALAAAAAACGLVLGALVPAGGGAGNEAQLWPAESRTADDEVVRALDLWLDPAGDGEDAR